MSTTQTNIDELYNDVCDQYFEELRQNCPEFRGKAAKKRGRNKPKPWWSSRLDDLWIQLVQKENMFKACHGSKKEKNNYNT